MLVTYEPQDVGALTRKQEAVIDVGIYYTVADDVDSADFGKAIVDELISQIRTTQENCGFEDISFTNIRAVRFRKEESGKQVVCQYVVELYCLYYD